MASGTIVAGNREEADRYLQRAGLPEFCGESVAWLPRLVVLVLSLAASVPTLIAIWQAPLEHWQEGVIWAAVFCGVIAVMVAAVDCRTATEAGRRTARWAHRAVFGVVGLAVLGSAGFVAFHGVMDTGASFGKPIKAYNLALALVAVALYVLAASGGIALMRAVFGEAIPRKWSGVRSAISAMPEMVMLVAFVIILKDAWKLLAPMAGWRVEALLLGCVLLATAAVAVHLGKDLGEIWKMDAPTALEAARKEPQAGSLVAGAAVGAVMRPLPSRARWNAVLRVVLPPLVRLLIAAATLTVFLFVVGLVLMDAGQIKEALPPDAAVPPPVAAAKVAGILSAFAAVAFAVSNKHRILQKMARKHIKQVKAGLGVWAVYYGGGDAPAQAAAMSPVSVVVPAH